MDQLRRLPEKVGKFNLGRRLLWLVFDGGMTGGDGVLGGGSVFCKLLEVPPPPPRLLDKRGLSLAKGVE